MKNKIWLVEMLHENQWYPTVGAAINREDAREKKAEWKARNPDDKFRITPYRSRNDK